VKTALTLIAGFFLGVLTCVAGAWLYFNHMMSVVSEARFDVPLDAKGRVEKSDRDYKAASDDYGRWLARSDGVLWTVDVLPPAQVREYATEVLGGATRYRTDWNYGNAVHKANLALGRLALRDGSKEEAKGFLLEAGKTPGSPQLNSFGPNMVLAKEMLERGNRDAVLEYLDLCSKFWSSDFGALKRWKALIAEGKQPNFAANLLY
jgi:hypothetical protein